LRHAAGIVGLVNTAEGQVTVGAHRDVVIYLVVEQELERQRNDRRAVIRMVGGIVYSWDDGARADGVGVVRARRRCWGWGWWNRSRSRGGGRGSRRDAWR